MKTPTITPQKLKATLVWRTRWAIVSLPKQALARLRFCRGHHRGPLYDGSAFCLTCGAPWFRRTL